jgi:hypothetical protein
VLFARIADSASCDSSAMLTTRGFAFTALAIGGLLAGTTVATGSPVTAQISQGAVLSSDLFGVTAVPGTGTFYAVGISQIAGADSFPVLIVRGHPGSWSAVSSSAPSQATLSAVAAASSHSIWTVGSYESSNVRMPLIMHSSGHGFSPQAAPRIRLGALEAVDAAAPDDAWAVGDRQHSGSSAIDPIALRWRGSAWKQVALNLPTQIQRIDDVTVTGPRNAWAVGTWYHDSSPKPHAALLHWNGRHWATAKAPHGARLARLDIDAASKHNAIATGFYYRQGQPTRFFIHWDGHRWSTQHPKKVGHLDGSAVDLAGTTGWAVGGSFNLGFGVPRQPLIVGWNGHRWTRVPAPRHGKYGSLVAVAVGTARRAAAVGAYDDGDPTNSHAMAFTYDGSAWSEDSVPESS